LAPGRLSPPPPFLVRTRRFRGRSRGGLSPPLFPPGRCAANNMHEKTPSFHSVRPVCCNPLFCHRWYSSTAVAKSAANSAAISWPAGLAPVVGSSSSGLSSPSRDDGGGRGKFAGREWVDIPRVSVLAPFHPLPYSRVPS